MLSFFGDILRLIQDPKHILRGKMSDKKLVLYEKTNNIQTKYCLFSIEYTNLSLSRKRMVIK